MKRLIPLIITILVLTLVIAACGGNQGTPAPLATIEMPLDNSKFKTGETFSFAATYNAKKLNADDLLWSITLLHGDHQHPDAFELKGSEGSWALPDHGDNTSYQLCLNTSTNNELNEIECIKLFHEEVTYTFDSVPSGLELEYNGTVHTTPFDVQTQVNSERTVNVVSPEDDNIFDFWSIGGDATQTIQIADTAQTITGFFHTQLPSTTKPEIKINGLDVTRKYAIGDSINSSVVVNDLEDGRITGEVIVWSILLLEQNQPGYEVYQQKGQTLNWVIPDHPDNSIYRICVLATDSSNTVAKECRNLQNKTVTYRVESVPQGLTLTYNDIIYQTPFLIQPIKNGKRSLFASSNQGAFKFEQWTFNRATVGSDQSLPLGEQYLNQSIVATYTPGTARYVEKTYVQLPRGIRPTTITWSKDGRMFIAEKWGKVSIVQNGVLLPEYFLDVSEETNNQGDRGLTGLALHPNFPATPYVYILYTYDPPEVLNYPGDPIAGPNGSGQRTIRLVRFTADSTKGYNSVIKSSAKVIVGKNSTWQNSGNPLAEWKEGTSLACTNGEQKVLDCIEQDFPAHAQGSIGFGKDGSLFFSVGDATNADRDHSSALRTQDLNAYTGKILRIDPETGLGLTDNPFFNGNAKSTQSKVYNLGLRNPFRFIFHPQTDELFISDVGWNDWEEINRGRGKNFGWPCYEGARARLRQTPSYATYQRCKDLYQQQADSGNVVTAPMHAWNHPDEFHEYGAAIIGPFYSGNSYPKRYKGALFFGDYNKRKLWASFVNGDDVQVEFLTDLSFHLTDIKQGPDGDLYMTDIVNSRIVQLSYEE